MKRTITGTCLAAALGIALSASAQQPPQPQPSQPTPPSQGATASLDREMKLTGCLKASTEAGTFELATSKKDKARGDASAAAQPPASTSSQAPAQDAMASAGASKNVKLVPASGVDLAAHLNHQVEVAGSWGAAAAAAAPATTPDGSGPKAGKTFSVTAVKMISAACTAGTN